jgi:hypothetical protein
MSVQFASDSSIALQPGHEQMRGSHHRAYALLVQTGQRSQRFLDRGGAVINAWHKVTVQVHNGERLVG